MKTIDQLKSEIDTMNKALEDATITEMSLDSSKQSFQLSQGLNKMAGFVSMAQVVVEYLDHLERSAERHRILSHEHMRNGDTSMSLRARAIAQHEDRGRAALMLQLTNAWNDSL